MMISNPERTLLLSSGGWAEHDALLQFDVAAGRSDTLPLNSGARFLTLHSAGSGYFSVLHNFDGQHFEVTVRSFSEPAKSLGRAWLGAGENRLDGDASAWRCVPSLYVDYLCFGPWKEFALVKVCPAAGKLEVQRLSWYDQSYNKEYQRVLSVLELPDEDGLALVSVQRSSQVVLHDIGTGMSRGTISLGGRGGNPALALRKSGKEIWASDLDTLAVVERGTWRTIRSTLLQGAQSGGQRFIGDFSFAPDEDLCLVARPFSGDVLGVDSATLEIRGSARLGGQPLEVVALARGEVAARDWKTGTLLRGILE
jgi:hypothetical protein